MAGALYMSKELIRPNQFSRSESIWNEEPIVLNEEQKKELSDLYEGSAQQFKQGKIIFGKVLQAGPEGVLVDIQYKSNGLIPAYEFSESELQKFTPGTDIEVILDEIENTSGNVMLSYEKAKALKAWGILVKLFEEGKPVEGIVTHKVKGGLSVDIGIPAFLPGSQVDVQRVTDFDQFVGQPITAHIIKINQKRGNVIISRRKFLHEIRSESRKKVLDILNVGQIIQGTVKNITNYGVFVDIGGVDGLLHITDMTWGRISHPSEMVKLGDVIAVKILSFDKENEKISLGLKQLNGNPWEAMGDAIAVGNKVKGTITSITDYGLFVEIEKGVEGLVHISEISWTDRISDLHKFYKVGDNIEMIIVSLDKENRRMSLSIKQLEKNPWDVISDTFEVGQKVTGKIGNITDFGMFVQIAPGVDGLVHISDLSWTEHIEHPADRFKRGDEIEAVIIGINKQNKKISLSIKQLSENPWENLEKNYPKNSMVEGEVSKITNFGAFVKLPSGIEGLVHISELSDQTVEKVEDVLKVGEKCMFRVINVSQADHKLALSLKPESESSSEGRQRNKKVGEKKSKDRTLETSAATSTSKQKSQLQLELEKHAARNESE